METANSDRAVLLCGLMGSGKSTVGALLAQALSWAFLDTDVEIERRAGRSIAAIFEQQGESGFRELERQVLNALPRQRVVVALGGGALNDPKSREQLHAWATLVWLDASPPCLVARIGCDAQRPLLAGLGREARIVRLQALLCERKAAYASAPLRLRTDGLEAEEVCSQVLEKLGGENA